MVDAGMDCLQALEVKAGMDVGRLAKRYGGRLAFCGNIDVRILCTNDRGQIDEAIQRTIPPVLEAGSGYILHSDHSIPPEVEYETLSYFLRRGRELAGAKTSA
jgi:uroporphyrinogen decarboxylase